MVFLNITATLLSLVCLTTALPRSCRLPRAQNGLAQTSYGPVLGYVGEYSTRYTVPYARPPVNRSRFNDPQPLTSSTEVYDASELPNVCPQITATGDIVGSEDCLYMNIYVPQNVTSTAPLPVFVWVHGGSYWAGSSTDFGLDGSNLAYNYQMIVVTLQYRLGVLGLMYSSSLRMRGNYALKDVIAALGYIKTNINAFGGDNSLVTLAGQSSGAELIKTLLVTPSATPLFNNAILHSPPLDHPDFTPGEADAVYNRVAASLGCTSLACLSGASVEDILYAQQNSATNSSSPYYVVGLPGVSQSEPYHPVVDGTLVTRSFDSVTESQTSLGSPKSLIFTTVKDEACTAVYSIAPYVYDPATYYDYIVTAALPDRAAAILGSGLYNYQDLVNSTDPLRDELLRLVSDYQWIAPIQQSAVNLTAAGHKVYLAQFDSGTSYNNNTIDYCVGKVNHQDDILPLFQGYVPALSVSGQPNMRVVTNELRQRWAAFARSGDPNATPYPGQWNQWDPVSSSTNLNLLHFGSLTVGRDLSTITATQRPEQCAVGTGLWGRIVPFDFQL